MTRDQLRAIAASANDLADRDRYLVIALLLAVGGAYAEGLAAGSRDSRRQLRPSAMVPPDPGEADYLQEKFAATNSPVGFRKMCTHDLWSRSQAVRTESTSTHPTFTTSTCTDVDRRRAELAWHDPAHRAR